LLFLIIKFQVFITSPHFQRQQNSPVVFNHSMLSNSCSATQFMGGSSPLIMRPPSPPIIGIPNTGYHQSYSMGNTLPPQVIYRPSDQDVKYKQNIIVRWLQPPTPPPSAPIIIRGNWFFLLMFWTCEN
jgi:hypothetical protein